MKDLVQIFEVVDGIQAQTVVVVLAKDLGHLQHQMVIGERRAIVVCLSQRFQTPAPDEDRCCRCCPPPADTCGCTCGQLHCHAPCFVIMSSLTCVCVCNMIDKREYDA